MRCGKSLEATVALGVAPLVSPLLHLGFLLHVLLIGVVVSGSEATELRDCSISSRRCQGVSFQTLLGKVEQPRLVLAARLEQVPMPLSHACRELLSL